MLRRSPLKRKTPLRSFTRLKPRQKKRTWPSPKEMGRTKCEVNWDNGCTGKATESHHVVLRSRGGSDDETNLITACSYCHHQVHLHPREATELGFMRHSWEREQ